MRFAPVQMVSGQAYDLSNAFRFSIQAVATGTPSGSLTLQVSNDQSSPSNWSNLQAPISISANGNTYYAFPDSPAKWVRITYTGTGSVVCSLFTQGV